MRALGLFAIGLIFGGAIGFLVAAGQGVEFDPHDHTDPAQHGGTTGEAAHLAHGETVAFGNPADLSVSMTLNEDPVAGYNLHFRGAGFTFAPGAAGQTHVQRQGHAHLYVNGAKIARLYGDWFHIPSLPAGKNVVTLTLNANDHRTYTIDGEPIELTEIVTVD